MSGGRESLTGIMFAITMAPEGSRVQIHVKLGEPLWRAVGSRRLVLDWPGSASVRLDEVLARLMAEYPGFAEAYAGKGLRKAYPYRLFVDASPVQLPEADRETAEREHNTVPRLSDGHTLFILLPAIGGRREPIG